MLLATLLAGSVRDCEGSPLPALALDQEALRPPLVDLTHLQFLYVIACIATLYNLVRHLISFPFPVPGFSSDGQTPGLCTHHIMFMARKG